MLECDWRVDKKRSIDFGIGSSDRIIENRCKGIKGTRVVSVTTVGRIPELHIELDDGRAISTFTAYASCPGWSIGFEDLRTIEVEGVWKENDVSVWLSYERGGFRRGYCFDEREFTDKAYLAKKYGYIV